MGLSYLQLAEKNKARMAFEQAAASNANMQIKEQAAYNYALCLHETSFSAFGESVTAFEKFLNEFPTSPYAEKVSSYLVEVYMNTRSYDAALKSIDRIAKPSAQILEAKQKILFQLGTQSFANADFEQALKYLNQSIAIGQYNRQTKADAYYWCGESYYRLNRMVEAARDFNAYLQLTSPITKCTRWLITTWAISLSIGKTIHRQATISKNISNWKKEKTQRRLPTLTTVLVTATSMYVTLKKPNITIRKPSK